MDEFLGVNASAGQSSAPAGYVFAFGTQRDEHAEKGCQEDGGNEGTNKSYLALVT